MQSTWGGYKDYHNPDITSLDSKAENGNIRVWTMELTEIGFSLFGNEKIKVNVMKALGRHFMRI